MVRWFEGVVVGVLVLIGASWGCSFDLDDPSEPLQVRAFASHRSVHVFVRREGDRICLQDFRDDDTCSGLGDACLRAADCFPELRLEHDGTVLAIEDEVSASVVMALDTPTEPGMELVVDGCGASHRLPLPDPKDTGAFEVNALTGHIDVHLAGPVVGIFGRVQGLSYLEWDEPLYDARCGALGDRLELPGSSDHSIHLLDAVAYDAPLEVAGDGIEALLFPAKRLEDYVFDGIEPGAVPEALVELAMGSPLYPPCEAYCRRWSETCVAGDARVEACTVQCTGLGEVSPSCEADYAALLTCSTDAIDCGPDDPEAPLDPCSDLREALELCSD